MHSDLVSLHPLARQPKKGSNQSTKRTSPQRHGDGHLRLGDRVHGAGEEGRLDGDLLGERAPAGWQFNRI